VFADHGFAHAAVIGDATAAALAEPRLLLR
jgi:hypothetical protein